MPKVPGPLLFEWRRSALHALRTAIVDERAFGRDGRIAQEQSRQRQAGAQLLPSARELAEALEARGPVIVGGKAHWARGWQHWLTENDRAQDAGTTSGSGGMRDVEDDPAAPPLSETEGALLSELEAVLRAEVAQAQEQFAGQARVAEITRWLTEVVAGWAYGQSAERATRWNVFRELSLPLAPAGSERFGRLDITVLPHQGRDLVIELDSAHKPASLEKLQFAGRAGAVPVWVRWKGGRVEHPDGVTVLDLVEATRGLVE